MSVMIYCCGLVIMPCDDCKLAVVVNFSIVDDPMIIWPLGSDLSWCHWSLTVCFHTKTTILPEKNGLGLASSNKCPPCGKWQTMLHNVSSCPHTDQAGECGLLGLISQNDHNPNPNIIKLPTWTKSFLRISFWVTVCKMVCPMLLDCCLSCLSLTLVAKRLDGSRCHVVWR